jgi:hypothetical protein
MKHSHQPAAIYDLTTLGSTIARHNVREFDGQTAEQLAQAHEETLELLARESPHKAPVPHTDPELLKAATGFAQKTLQLLQIAEDQNRIGRGIAAKTRSTIEHFMGSLRLLEGTTGVWLCDDAEIDTMFGMQMSAESANAIMSDETQKLSGAEIPSASPQGLRTSVTEGETQRLFKAVRKDLFGAGMIDPQLYIESKPEKHYLFWTPTAERQECAVPDCYSVADHFRFHCPHNDAHLSHLHDLSSYGVGAYTDFMDERAFLEAIAVLSEWQILEALKADRSDLAASLHDALESDRRKQVSPESLRRWMIEMRTYECRLRAARLVADVLTIQERLPFEEMVERSMAITGLTREDAEAEARKYYFLPGLGAVYTLGYRKMLENGIDNPIAGFKNNGTTIRTWHQFHAQHDS